jgi:hypothetical protein
MRSGASRPKAERDLFGAADRIITKRRRRK